MIRQTFIIDVEMEDDFSRSFVKINIQVALPPDATMATAMTATEHMMTNFAASSALGFEGALQSLCEGARSNKIQILGGVRTQ